MLGFRSGGRVVGFLGDGLGLVGGFRELEVRSMV